MQLYKLTEQFERATAEIGAMLDSGEIDESTMADTLEGLEGEVEDKCLNVGLHIKNLRSDLSQLEAVKKEFEQKIKAAKSSLEFYERYLENNMERAGLDKLKNQYADIKWKKLPPIVDVVGDVPDEYSRVIPEKREPDKRLIGEKLKAGESLPFAKLITDRRKLDVK